MKLLGCFAAKNISVAFSMPTRGRPLAFRSGRRRVRGSSDGGLAVALRAGGHAPGGRRPRPTCVSWKPGRAGSRTWCAQADTGSLRTSPRKWVASNSGPTPYDFLSIVLGACTSMTLRLYADRKNIPLGRVSVDVAHEKVHAVDCADCAADASPDAKIDHFTRTIAVDTEATEELRTKIIEIANKDLASRAARCRAVA